MEKNITTAEELAKLQREISVSEFFLKNRHLLGFDNPRKALLTVVKECVDNSLDACQDMKILPEIKVEIKSTTEGRYLVSVEDNGPGIVKEQVPKVFGKLLYGSKFHRYRQSRGIQGIGVSSSVMYGQLTTGKSSKIISRIGPKKKAYYCELYVNTKTNEPQIAKEEEVEWHRDHGVKVEIELEAIYQKGQKSVDEYIKQTALANPHAQFIYKAPDNDKPIKYPRSVAELPKEPKEIKPHPYGVELGVLIKMLGDTKASTLQGFLTNDFCRVSPKVAKQICEAAGVYVKSRPSRIARQEADNLMKAIKKTKIMAPPTDCLVPIGEESLIKSLKKEIVADFYTATTRSPSVYRGMPFQIDAGLAFGGGMSAEELSNVMRFANRVPLLYQQSACAITKSILQTNWRNYGLQQSKGALPIGPLTLFVHIASVWVPFTSESKEAVASYPEIIDEIKLALQECGRKLNMYLHKKHSRELEGKKQSYIKKYLPHIGIALKEIINLDEKEKQKLLKILEDMLERSRVKLDTEFNEELAQHEK